MLYIMNKVWFISYPPGSGPWVGRLNYRCTFMFVKCLNSVGLHSSLLNLMGMAIDHFVAILKPLHYPAIMKKSKVRVQVIYRCTASCIKDAPYCEVFL